VTPASIRQDGSLERAWTGPGGLRATLTHYRAAERHAAHAHGHHQVSFVLAGELVERLEGKDHVARSYWRGHKPAGARHSDEWGADGVLVFTLNLDDGFAAGACLSAEPGWHAVEEPGTVRSLVRLIASGPGAEIRREAALDLLGADARPASPAGAVPHWLARVRDSIHDSPEVLAIEAAAREAGVHRSQLARMFRRHYGVPPSVYRRRLLLARAADALARSPTPLAQVAADAGFCDQSHLSRALRSETGLTPAQLRRLLHRRHSSKN
jgi:AraC family transcriptional regulator